MINWIKNFFGIRTDNKAEFEIYQDKKTKWRFRLLAPNGEIITHGEDYASKRNCIRGILAVKKYARNADIK